MSIGTLLAFVLVMHRRHHPAADGAGRCRARSARRGCRGVPILGALICLAQMVGLPLTTWIRLIVWLVVGLAIYFLYGRQQMTRQIVHPSVTIEGLSE